MAMPVTVAVVLSAVEVEYRAMRSHVHHIASRRHVSGTMFEVGTLPTADVTVALALVGEGNTTAAIVTEQAIAAFHPDVVLLVGVAESIAVGVLPGDVVVGTKVYAYHGGKDGPEFLARPRSWDAPHAWEQSARHLALAGTWRDHLPSDAKAGTTVYFEPIAAGEVAAAAAGSNTAERLRRHYNDAVAVEMEGAGVVRAAHIRAVPALVICGISTDAAAERVHAAAAAAAFAAALLTDATRAPGHSEPEAAVSRRRRQTLDFLPADLRDFVGREEQLRQLDDHVAEGSGTVVISAVDGTAGVGKTTLAVHWAHEAKHLFHAGRLYIDLRGFSPGHPLSPRRALGVLLSGLGVPDADIPAGVDARAAHYQRELRGKRFLIVLDNASDTDQLRPLLPHARDCVCVVTSRHRLSALAVGTNTRLVTLGVLGASESRQLLAVVLGEATVASQSDAAAQLAQLCGHLPLALRIAAVRLLTRPGYRITDAVEELLDENDRLDNLRIDGDEHAAVRSVFSWSYRRLGPGEQRAFRLLGLMPGESLGALAIAALWGSTARVPPQLAALVTLHLVEEDRPGRYRIHDLLRLYAARLCSTEEPTDARSAAVERLLHWYVITAEAADAVLGDAPSARVPPLAGRDDVEAVGLNDADAALSWFDAEYTTMLGMARHAVDNGLFELTWRLPLATWSFFQRRSRWLDWIPLQQLGLDAARHVGDRQAEAWLLTGLGDVYDDLERYDEALDQHRAALEIQTELGNTRGVANTVNNLAVTLDNLERYEEAITHYEQALTGFREIDDRFGVAMTLNNLGTAHFMLDDLEAAARRYKESLAVRRGGDRHDHFGEAMTLHNLGEVAEAEGRLADARRWFEESLPLHGAAGHIRGRARAHDRLGTVAVSEGDRAAARSHWETAARLYDSVDDPDVDEVLAHLHDLDSDGQDE